MKGASRGGEGSGPALLVGNRPRAGEDEADDARADEGERDFRPGGRVEKENRGAGQREDERHGRPFDAGADDAVPLPVRDEGAVVSVAHQPGVEPLGAAREGEGGEQHEGRGGQERQEHADDAQTEGDQPQRQEEGTGDSSPHDESFPGRPFAFAYSPEAPPRANGARLRARVYGAAKRMPESLFSDRLQRFNVFMEVV